MKFSAILEKEAVIFRFFISFMVEKDLPNLLKRVIIIIPITKDEAMFIRSRKNVHISKPTRHGKRFMEEDVSAMKLLKEYRSGKYPMGGKH